MEKKLKRGLADLSKLFLSETRVPEVPQVITLPQAKKEVLVSPPHLKHDEPPSLLCASFIPISRKFQIGDFVALLERAHGVFSETFLLTESENLTRYREFQSLFSLPEQAAALDQLHSLGNGIIFGCVNEFEARDILTPHAVAIYKEPSHSLKKALVVFDSQAPDDPLADVLDHCVYVLEADPKQLTQAYQLMRFSFARNPMVRNSIFLVGDGIGETCDLIYDRFSMTISQLLGSDLGFLGWADEKEMLCNPSLLLEEAGNPIQLSSKARLTELLYSAALT